jgi:deazaflavin-dependent oxidoreductase (nitroreductase family)
MSAVIAVWLAGIVQNWSFCVLPVVADRGLNRVTKHIAPWTPGFGVVIHRGRRSGREYHTPVNVFATEDGYVLALTYSPDTDWVRNVLAADGCELRTRGRVIRLVSPRLFHDETRRAICPLERQVVRVLGVTDFLSLKTAPAARQRPASPDRLIAGSDGTPLLPPS